MPQLTPPTPPLHGIIESSDDAIIGENLEGLITLWNPAAERVFGYTSAEAIGQNAQLIVPETLRSEADRTRAQALLGTVWSIAKRSGSRKPAPRSMSR